MKIKVKNNCPLNKFEPCKELECGWFIQVRGVNPNTGEEVDEYGCAVSWLPIMLIDNTQKQRETGAAVESFRNEMVRSNHASAEIFQALVNTPNALTIESNRS